MVGTMGARCQLRAVPPDFECMQVGAPERAEIQASARPGSCRLEKPLPSPLPAILETGIAHVTDLETRQPASDLATSSCISGCAFSISRPQMSPLPLMCDIQYFGYPEVLWQSLEFTAAAARGPQAKGPRHSSARESGHTSLSNQADMHAPPIPSSRPTKPVFRLGPGGAWTLT